jgi:hypothetical protein
MWGVFRYELVFGYLVILIPSSWWIFGCLSMVAGGSERKHLQSALHTPSLPIVIIVVVSDKRKGTQNASKPKQKAEASAVLCVAC